MHTSLRWPWAVASLFLLGAAVVTARATYLFWLPCRGSMTRGSIFATESSEGRIPDACLAQMDAGTPFPYASNEAGFPAQGAGLTAVAMALTGLAWLVLVIGPRWRPQTLAVAVLPALLSMGLAVSSATAMQSGAAREDAYAAASVG